MTERILLPYDGSEPSEQALEYALETFPDAEITALYVVPAPRGYWGSFEDPEARIPDAERAKERGREFLEEAVATAADRDRELETELEIGEPDHVIVGRATDGEYDSIVLGSHGREGVSRILLGSVAENVVRRSPTPVVVVR
ncbi:universal stress protein [Natronococcus occultus]|uniref:Universal stress protein UspA-like protein n=1 Tax=Natronococcus occultus SP4 TaxID=694430 RepID=L0K6B4_9EURY|nr:universal stress protein [Natronococcus occultus]AGB39904.1 universal stress protein UspA-like protein [Natronococcus occultus SP4]